MRRDPLREGGPGTNPRGHDPGSGLRGHVGQSRPESFEREPDKSRGRICKTCGRREFPDHDANSPGPTVRHPFVAMPEGGSDIDGHATEIAQTATKLDDVLHSAILCVCGEPRGEHPIGDHQFEQLVPKSEVIISNVRPARNPEQIAEAITSIRALYNQRMVAQHRPGTGPAYRQEGERNAFDMVINLLEHGDPEGKPVLTAEEVGDPNLHERIALRVLERMIIGKGPREEIDRVHRCVEVAREADITPAPSITCPTCARTSYNPNDVRERYCGVCGYHDRSLIE